MKYSRCDYLAEYLVLVKRRVLRRLIINVPPRTLKSTLVTVIFPLWTWLTEQFLTASYSLGLSSEHQGLLPNEPTKRRV